MNPSNYLSMAGDPSQMMGGLAPLYSDGRKIPSVESSLLNWGSARHLLGYRSTPILSHPEFSCLYCASIITGNRCQSCGAPRKAEKYSPDTTRFPECLHPELS